MSFTVVEVVTKRVNFDSHTQLAQVVTKNLLFFFLEEETDILVEKETTVQ